MIRFRDPFTFVCAAKVGGFYGMNKRKRENRSFSTFSKLFLTVFDNYNRHFELTKGGKSIPDIANSAIALIGIIYI